MKHRDVKAKLLKDPDVKRDYDALHDDQERRREAIRLELEKQGNALLASMQNPENRARLDAFFDMTPEELGKAAVEAARKKPRNPKRV